MAFARTKSPQNAEPMATDIAIIAVILTVLVGFAEYCRRLTK
jgi:hypothetical protein